jgi:hypothetical protein
LNILSANIGTMSSTSSGPRQWQSKNPLWFIVPTVASVAVLLAGHPGWALLLYIASLAAAVVAHPETPYKRTAVVVLIAVPVLAVLVVGLFLVAWQ